VLTEGKALMVTVTNVRVLLSQFVVLFLAAAYAE
jgi:hypothetical protein